MVFISQGYYHNWRARVDGKAVPLWRANYAFQAVEVPAGHEVTLVYRDKMFWFGMLLAVWAGLVCVALWFRPGGLATAGHSHVNSTNAPSARPPIALTAPCCNAAGRTQPKARPNAAPARNPPTCATMSVARAETNQHQNEHPRRHGARKKRRNRPDICASARKIHRDQTQRARHHAGSAQTFMGRRVKHNGRASRRPRPGMRPAPPRPSMPRAMARPSNRNPVAALPTRANFRAK